MNRVRDRIGLNLPPLFLRVLLGVVFVWAGLGKLSAPMDVQGADAAALARMGVIEGPRAGAPAAPTTPAPAGTGPGAGLPGGDGVVRVSQTGAGSGAAYSAEDFPDPVAVKRVYGLALVIQKAAYPPPAADGSAQMPLWPPAIGGGKWPVYLAWAVAATELSGGVLVLLGLFTRVWSLGLAGVMLGAMWLTEIGPAVQAAKTVLGFLPAYPRYGSEWQHPLLQFSLFMSAMALALLGPGRASLDHVLLGPRREDDDED